MWRSDHTPSLHPNGGFTRDERDCVLLRIARVDLKNLELRGSRSDGAHDHAEQRSRSAHSRRVRLSRCGDTTASPRCASGRRTIGITCVPPDRKPPAVYLRLHHGRVVVNQERNRVKIVDVRHFQSDCCRVSLLDRDVCGIKLKLCRGRSRLTGIIPSCAGRERIPRRSEAPPSRRSAVALRAPREPGPAPGKRGGSSLILSPMSANLPP